MSAIIRTPSLASDKRKLFSSRKTQSEQQPSNPANSGEVSDAISPSAQQSNSALTNLVEQARQAVLGQFKEEAEAARELARQRGLREGRQAGIDESKQNFIGEISRMKSIADKLPEALAAGVVGMEDLLVEIAFEAVCKILSNPAVTRDAILPMVKQATARTLGHEKVVVRLNESDLVLLRKVGALGDELQSGASVSWIADSKIALGGCVVETELGDLDARLETQLQNLRKTLLAARRSNALGTD